MLHWAHKETDGQKAARSRKTVLSLCWSQLFAGITGDDDQPELLGARVQVPMPEQGSLQERPRR